MFRPDSFELVVGLPEAPRRSELRRATTSEAPTWHRTHHGHASRSGQL